MPATGAKSAVGVEIKAQVKPEYAEILTPGCSGPRGDAAPGLRRPAARTAGPTGTGAGQAG